MANRKILIAMKQEDKELLLKDLCVRLPYGVKGIITYDKSRTTFTIEGINNNVLHLSDTEECYVEDFKPYLRHMSSMTEEEKTELNEVTVINYNEFEGVSTLFDEKGFDWLNKHHFDYRGLIERGLAFAVAPENNPYKN